MRRNENGTYQFDTSAFLPVKTQGTWQRFALSCSAEQMERILSRRMELAEHDSEAGTSWRTRRYDRSIVNRYAVNR